MKQLAKVSIALFVLAGCASEELTAGAANVRVISQDQAKACKFLDSVSSDNGNTLAKSPEEDARNRARNAVAAKGGNALRIITTNTQVSESGVGSTFHISGEAYSCSP